MKKETRPRKPLQVGEIVRINVANKRVSSGNNNHTPSRAEIQYLFPCLIDYPEHTDFSKVKLRIYAIKPIGSPNSCSGGCTESARDGCPGYMQLQDVQTGNLNSYSDCYGYHEDLLIYRDQQRNYKMIERPTGIDPNKHTKLVGRKLVEMK